MTPAGKLGDRAWLEAPEARAVVAALTAKGGGARFVGGCVRDAVLGRPVRDIDIAASEPPDRIMARLAAAGIRAIPTGIEHGTVTAVVGERHFEITTLRLDIETDGRRAQVAYTDDWKADAARRDFTINALYCDPDGTLYDPFGGIDDLKAGRVRFVGSAMDRIREDVLRILRFFRFHAHYGRPPPNAEAMAACRALAHLLPGLSGERVAAELMQLLLAPDPVPALGLMSEAGVLGRVLPEADEGARLRALVVIEDAAAAADSLRRLAALLSPGRPAAEAVAARLRLSRKQRDRLAALATPAAEVGIELTAVERRRLLYRLGAPLFRDLVLLAWAAAAARPGVGWRRGARRWRALLADADAWSPVALPVKGRDALALGIAPGPQVGRLLAEVEAWWVEGDFRAERDELLAELRARAAGTSP